jgi:hypothetical protein
MPKAIWKYALNVDDSQELLLPAGAVILAVGAQSQTAQDLQLWAMVDQQATEHPPQPRTIRIYGTGHAIADDLNLRHIGTVIRHMGILVWHVFEVLP